MTKRPIRTPNDFLAFFQAFSRQDWEETLSYLHEDCVWDATEQRLKGREAIRAYWTGAHAAIRESLSPPTNIAFTDTGAYLQTTFRLEFIQNGSFLGQSYVQGSVVEVPCVDVYTLAPDGTIQECRVYPKFRPGT
ncbi:MAG: nuclear transport factor 2 family protein [Deltaproteobacteria bacterium]|nr:nuclear transport factor 2 family protein [Deltaproteobacteria bacterium]